MKLDYITIPVLAKYYVADAFSIEFSHQIGFLVSAKSKSSGESEDVKDQLKSTDVSLNFGLGYYRKFFDLVPEFNLQDINGNNQGTTANSYLGIHLGFYVGEVYGENNHFFYLYQNHFLVVVFFYV